MDSKSGFSFDPAHAFEKFDFDAIKDPGLRENAREGVEKILAGAKPEESAEEEKTSFKGVVTLDSLAKDGGDRIVIGVFH